MFHRADERMQYTINGLSFDGDAFPSRIISRAACGSMQAAAESAADLVLATSSGGARRVDAERLTTLPLPVYFSL